MRVCVDMKNNSIINGSIEDAIQPGRRLLVAEVDDPRIAVLSSNTGCTRRIIGLVGGPACILERLRSDGSGTLMGIDRSLHFRSPEEAADLVDRWLRGLVPPPPAMRAPRCGIRISHLSAWDDLDSRAEQGWRKHLPFDDDPMWVSFVRNHSERPGLPVGLFDLVIWADGRAVITTQDGTSIIDGFEHLEISQDHQQMLSLVKQIMGTQPED